MSAGAGISAPWYGDHPNLSWRCVPLSDLRRHPRFVPLPDPALVSIRSPVDYALFQQDSEQWNRLHQARLTAGSLAVFLGFFETAIAKRVGVPKSITGHKRAIDLCRNLATGLPWVPMGLEATGTATSAEEASHIDGEGSRKPEAVSPWLKKVEPTASESFDPVIVYNPCASGVPAIDAECVHASDARRLWGKLHEATGLLAVLDHVAPPGALLHEVGLLAMEATTSTADASTLPLMGASPDGLLVYADGTSHIVEVKCHCPFDEYSHKERGAYVLRDDGPYTAFPAWHVPQVQFEMFCAGTLCSGAFLISLSATKGANVFWMPRNDTYIAALLAQVQFVFQRFVKVAKCPPPMYLNESPAYQKFVEASVHLARTAELRIRIPADKIQRRSPEPFFIPT
jgi:hypothetical protein